MRPIFSIFLFLYCCSQLPAQPENPAEYGVIRFMNLVNAGQGNLQLVLDGKNPKKEGFRLGQRTGPVPFPAGVLNLKLSKENCLPAERELAVKAGQSQTIIIYAEKEFDKEERLLGWQIKITSLEQQTPKKGMVVTFVSFCKEDVLDLEVSEGFSGKTLRQSVRKRKRTPLQIVEQGRVRATIRYRGEQIGAVNVDEPGNYVAIIYEGSDQRKKIEIFYDSEFLNPGD